MIGVTYEATNKVTRQNIYGAKNAREGRRKGHKTVEDGIKVLLRAVAV